MSIITLFPSIYKPKEPTYYDLIEFLENIRDGYWYEIVMKCRNISDKKARNEFKDNMPTASFAGKFSYRNDASLEEHSGIMAMDWDDGENLQVVRAQLEKDAYVFAVFLSVSGKGLRILFRIDPKKHTESFNGLMDYLNKTYGIVCDTNSSLSKPYIVSFDPKLYMKMEFEDTKIFKQYPKETPVKKLQNFVHTDDDFLRVLREISQRNISIAEDYNDYLKVGFAIASKYGENGRDYFHEVCRPSQKYDAKKVDSQYKYCLRDYGKNKANIATFYYFAKLNGVNITSETTKTIIRTTKTGKKAGLSKEQIALNLKKYNNLENTEDVVSQIFDEQETLEESEEQSILFQLEMFISNNYSLELNDVTGFLEQNRKQLSAGDLNSIFISAKKMIPTVDYNLMMRLLKSDFIPKYNPFFEFFGSDGIPYILPPIPELNEKNFDSPLIDLLAQTIENENPAYTAFFIRKWIVSIISSAHKIHSPLLLCLLGGQNTGKCLGKGTKVMMCDGTLKNVEDIIKGDLLMGLNGEIRTVISTTTGVEQMYWIRQKRGVDYRVNESHILSLKHRIDGRILNISVSDHLKRGELKKYQGYKTVIDIDNDVNLSIDPYFLGLWIGDGRSKLDAGICIETADEKIVDYLKEYALVNNNYLSKYEQNGSKSNSYAIVQSYGSGCGLKKDLSSLKNRMRYLNLDGNKHIPEEFKFSSKKQRLELLAGLIDSDGSISNEYTYEITQKNKIIADDICFLCRSIGFSASLNKKIVNKEIYWRVFIGGDLSIIPVKLDRKKVTRVNTKQTLLTEITIQKDIIDEYFGFEIDGDKLFCLEDFTVTHNTEWFRRLLPQELQSYYAESKLDKEKDDELLMTENLIIMDDELGGKSKQDNLKLKNITSKQYFSLRRPYADHNEKILRLAVLCGTSNTLQIMSDTTGNRRIIPIEVTNVNKELYNSINKKDLFLEAFRIYKEGFDWRITHRDIEYLNKDQERYEMIVPERELLERYFLPIDKVRLSSTDIKVELELLTRQKLNPTALARELERGGFLRKTTAGGTGSKKWCVNRINRGSDEQTDLQKETF